MKEVTQTISRENLGKIYPLVCNRWQRRINEALNKNKFAVNIEVDEDLIKEAFSEADRPQTGILEKYFKYPEVGFQAKDLKVGEIMKVTKDGGVEGKHIMRIYDELVCLESPDLTWSSPAMNTIEGIKLETGTKFTLTAR
jgi:hypothetical protein